MRIGFNKKFCDFNAVNENNMGHLQFFSIQ